jgi:hypothetical protein
MAPNAAAVHKSYLEAAVENIDRILAGANLRTTIELDIEETIGEHLFNQLLLPETFFVAPPRCNVLFPDMYFSFNFSRNYLREVSRLACQGGLGMIAQGQHSGILGRHYFAPNIKDAKGKWARRTVFSSGTVLMPHEVHSGIIPKFEWVTDGHRWGVNASKGRGRLTKNKKIAYVQRLANYQFFMHRWASRSMNAQARFNPHMVIGFPGVIIDRATPSIASLVATGQSAADATDISVLPTAYVGKVVALQHSVSQDGGTTSISYTHCRTHRGSDDEFLGILEREAKESVTDTVDVVSQDILDDIEANRVPDVVQLKLLQLWVKGNLAQNRDLSIGTVGDVRGDNVTRRPVDTSIEVGLEEIQSLGLSFDDFLSLRARQADIRSELQDPNLGVRLPSALKVDLEVRAQEGKILTRAGLPFEEAVRPGWYSEDVWNNENISSKVYGPLLGTTAITDDRQVGDPEEYGELIKVGMDVIGLSDSSVTVEQDGEFIVLRVDVQGRVSQLPLGFALQTGATTETAIDGLTTLYGILKQRGLDVQSFIDDYVKRPIANMVEILGDSDFQLDASGEPKARVDGTQPFEGFHSRAFGPYNADVKQRTSTAEGTSPPKEGADALLGLIPSAKKSEFNRTGTVVNRGKKTVVPVPAHLDPRGRAQSRVRNYADELTYSRGILAT